MVAALNDYMHHGGVLVIDLQGGGADAAGSGAGAAPDAAASLRRLGRGLDIPRLTPLTSAHVLAHAFYLLADFPGRFDGDTVWVQLDQDRSNDSVSPVIGGRQRLGGRLGHRRGWQPVVRHRAWGARGSGRWRSVLA